MKKISEKLYNLLHNKTIHIAECVVWLPSYLFCMIVISIGPIVTTIHFAFVFFLCVRWHCSF